MTSCNETLSMATYRFSGAYMFAMAQTRGWYTTVGVVVGSRGSLLGRWWRRELCSR